MCVYFSALWCVRGRSVVGDCGAAPGCVGEVAEWESGSEGEDWGASVSVGDVFVVCVPSEIGQGAEFWGGVARGAASAATAHGAAAEARGWWV